MTRSIIAAHTIVIDLPVDRCQKLFTPAGEELWVDGWCPRYLHPADGRTTPGMLFMTGTADEMTVWTLVTYTQAPHRARYARITPASRWGFVDVECEPNGDGATRVTVRYSLHALEEPGIAALAAFEPGPYAAMIDGWKDTIDRRMDLLRDAEIR